MKSQIQERLDALPIRFLMPFLFGMLALTPLVFSLQSLQKGQIVKQFTAYSITESLSRNPLGWLSSILPCTPPRLWTEEPPLFHFIAGTLLRVFPQFPALLSYLSFLLIGAGVFFLLLSNPPNLKDLLNPKDPLNCRDRWLTSAAVLFTPALLRYSIQHLPDLFATCWLLWGAVFYYRNQRGLAACFWTVAVATKVLVIFSVCPLLIWDLLYRNPGENQQGDAQTEELQNKYRKFLKKGFVSCLQLSFYCFPFLIWMGFVFYFKIPSPLSFDHLVENRHSGGLALLLSPHYYLRAFTWIAIKGVGVFLFFPALWRIFEVLKNLSQRQENPTSQNVFLIFWSAGLIPYWLLVRQGNFVHDYYSLPFIIPIALLGAAQVVSWVRNSSLVIKYGALIALVFNLFLGHWGLFQLQAFPLERGLTRPYFCGVY